MTLETSVFEDIVAFITNTAKLIGFNWIAIIAFALLLLVIVISFVCTMFSIDAKTSKAVQQINLYLEKNPYVNEENLVEFNKLMKRIPAPMRTQWQQYMVGRDKKPSQYFTEENCIDKPFKSSSYASHIFAVKVLTVCIAVIAFVFSAGALSDVSLGQVLLQSVLISGLVAILGSLYVLFLKSRRSALLFDLYYNFTNLKNYLDRAVTTLPDYVDYEIMFTKKEISAGIPVLQEYLKKRAEYEQLQIEKAKASQVEHEQYDFSVLGVDAAIIMEKAMRECEYMLGNKKRILSEISELQSNLESYERTYDEKLKGTQRKLRDIQESLDRLKEKLQSTTNMIVGNDLRKQRENEIEKQRNIEKESAEDTRKFEQTKKEILDQIQAKRDEIEGFRKNAEAVLTDEFRAYSDKIYREIKGIAENQVKDELDSAHQNIQTLQQELEDKERVIVEKTTLLNEQLDVENYANELQTSYEELRVAYNEVVKELDEKDRQIAQMGEAENHVAEKEPYVEPIELKEEKPVEVDELEKPAESSFTEGASLKEEELFAEQAEAVEQPQQEIVEENNLVEEQPKPEKKHAAHASIDSLARENEILSKQLENTQEILKAIVKPKKSSKPKAKKKAVPSKYAGKPWSKREDERPKNDKKASDDGNDDNGFGGVSLEEFNEQLNNAISDISSNQDEGEN